MSLTLTFRYKTGFIHESYVTGLQIIRVQVDQFAYAIQVKSIRAAKLLITKHNKKIGGISI